MINLKIGAMERHFESIIDVDGHWINQQINGLRKDGHSICVRISINESKANLTLATADCASANGGGRPPNECEEEIFSLWNRLGLNDKEFQLGKIIAFLKQVRRIIN